MNKRSLLGFSLLELMVVLAIAGILVSVAYPAYTSHMMTARRADAAAALSGFSNAMVRYATNNFSSYCDAGGAGGANSCGAAGTNDTGTPSIFPGTVPLDGGAAYYNLTIQGVTAVTYSLRATPIGIQAGDVCGALEITHLGRKVVIGAAGMTWDLCWR
ncbi:MAG: prepilin-type N-terminal cleavage/methylation domain-containing protein [Gammaproteobacteria bacterium]|nr:prepilin-type N-terminal cleavage/methylation domain-containing protein [Gammaproteobacteria bacterium]